MIWKLPNSSSVLVTAEGRITLCVVRANQPFRRSRLVCVRAPARTALLQTEQRQRRIRQMQPWVYFMEVTVARNIPAVLDHRLCELRPQTTRGLWGMVLSLLFLSPGFVTRSAPKPALLSQVGDVITQQRMLCVVTRAAHVSLYSGQMCELSPPTAQRVPPVQGGCSWVTGCM